ncbi:MAG: FAD:protein FMN transferase, partial [Oscillospiraceae bacterium]|nr:FAD:protein FMN transferase [Oscillospiraceae bacterium]
PDKASLPDMEKLQQAAQHVDFEKVVIDQAASTVYISDPLLRLDVGAIAKGWAVQRVAENAPEGILISVGGNVCATGPKDSEGTPWVIGIQDPYSDGNLCAVYLSKGCVVTSGDYQRTYEVDGKKYHHIIDPATLMPSTYWQSVTIVCEDSGLADALSTALFVLPLEEGRALAEKYNVQAYWFAGPGEEYMTPGFEEMLRS